MGQAGIIPDENRRKFSNHYPSLCPASDSSVHLFVLAVLLSRALATKELNRRSLWRDFNSGSSAISPGEMSPSATERSRSANAWSTRPLAASAVAKLYQASATVAG